MGEKEKQERGRRREKARGIYPDKSKNEQAALLPLGILG